MPNHFHMICSCIDNSEPGMVFKNIKSFTAIKIIDAILNNPKESRRHWILDIFEKNGKLNKNNYRYQFWQHENHPILLDHYSNSYIDRLNYIHQNPVRGGFVTEAQHWLYSSAMDYYNTEKGLLEIVMI
jgi:putative transposase